MSFGRDQIDRDDRLAELYQLLADRNRPSPGSFSALSAEGRRAYFADRRRANRGRERASALEGSPKPTSANVRAALADAALMILATGAPGADHVRMVLGAVFAKRPGVPVGVEQKARSGRLRPKLAVRP